MRRGDPSLSLNTAMVLILAVYAAALLGAFWLINNQGAEQ